MLGSMGIIMEYLGISYNIWICLNIYYGVYMGYLSEQ